MFEYAEFFDDNLEELNNIYDYESFKELIERIFYNGLTKKKLKLIVKLILLVKILIIMEDTFKQI